MANKTVIKENLKKNDAKSSKPVVTAIDKKKQNVPAKKSSAVVASSKGRSAVNQVKAGSSRDVRGSSGLANTGTIISYD